ncbi:MAG: hypothetical protein J2P48_14230 [Alphaproteobacteria bacterium]|nr:hypothetical protein [Alphaproteobacteria bacterium]
MPQHAADVPRRQQQRAAQRIALPRYVVTLSAIRQRRAGDTPGPLRREAQGRIQCCRGYPAARDEQAIAAISQHWAPP